MSGAVFEIFDFSTATAWERLIRGLEERLRQWGAQHSRTGSEGVRTCELLYNDRSYRLTRSQAGDDRDASAFLLGRAEAADEAGSGSEHEALAAWLGLRSFLVLAPSTRRKVSRNEAGLLLSALSLAAAAAQCALPTLVTVGERWKREYWGRSTAGGSVHRAHHTAGEWRASMEKRRCGR